MGTPIFAVESLKKIHQSGYNISAVICPIDKPAGRGQKLTSCEVKKYAQSQNFKILQPKSLKDEEFIKNLKTINADIFVVVAFRMLPKEVWSIPKYGTFNIHGSLLPNYRGAAPINWAIINGEHTTGVTSFFINESIDSGAIILKKKCSIGPKETAGDIHDKLMVLGSNLAVETCDAILNNKINPIPQKEHENLYNAPKLYKNNCKIDWNKSTIEIYNLIRGLSPYPSAWTNFTSPTNELKSIKIHQALYKIEFHNKNIGEIETNKKEMKIYTRDGFINILQIQIPGKIKMHITSFLNGLNHKSYKKAL